MKSKEELENKINVILQKHGCSNGNFIPKIIELINQEKKSYHQSRINSISDEMIENEVSSYDRTDVFQSTHRNGFNQGARWFKQKLLNT